MGIIGAAIFVNLLDAADRRVGTGGVVGAFAIIGAAVVGGVFLKKRTALARAEDERRQAAERLSLLSQRFGEANARRIVDKTLWQGATEDMIREMLGDPEDVSRKVYKTKTTETWKYDRLDARRFRLQLTLENGICVGWKTP